MTFSPPFSSKIQQAAKYSRDPKLRQRALLFMKALELGSIAQACREFGTSPQLYHYWWRRFEKSGFQKEALKEKSRRPHRSPRQVPGEVARWIGRYSKAGHKAEKIRRLLEKEKNRIVSLPTVYRVLSRGGFVRRKKGREKREPAPLPSSERLKVAQKIGDRYRVLRILGSGGGGTVHLVEDLKRGGEKLALKLLEIRKETDRDLIDHLKNEFVALASLTHPHLAKVYDLGLTKKEIFFTTEYIRGKDLQSAAQDADLNLIFQWIVQILSALDYLHRKGIVHRDLKPSNILVTDPDAAGMVSVKLIDFGSADCRKTGQAAPGELMGTPPYVAPEILMEKPAGPASDLYSLGMILHQIFLGAFPFEEKDPLLMMKEQIYQEPKPLTGLPPSLPEGFNDFLLKMIARDPLNRFSSAGEVLKAMNQILEETYSLRSLKAPVRILEESDFEFRSALAEEILTHLLDPRPVLVILSGEEGIGKSRVFDRVKESLQLKGIFPFAFREASSLLDLLQSDPKMTKAPVLVDLDEEGDSLSKIIEVLDLKKVRALVTTRRPKSHDFFAHHWVELKPLSSEEILHFFRTEIPDFPIVDPLHPLTGLCEGNPKKLEPVLQALQEEGALQWTDLGWQWQKDVEVNFEDLLSSQETRWKERRERVLEILTLSPLAMSAESLGGILGLPLGPLEEKLAEWAKEGSLKTKTVKKASHYWIKDISPKGTKLLLEKDWDQLEEELKTLYAKGNFEAGIRWADLILSDQVKKESIPPQILILAARHYVAFGKASRALEILPSEPSELIESGLYFEVRGRAQFNLGSLEEAEENLKRAEEVYENQNQSLGLARVFNMRASLLKKQNDFPRAEEALRLSIQKAEEGGDFYVQGLSQMNLALSYQEQGDYDRAIATFEEASHSAEQARHPLLTARLIQNRVNLFFSMGRAAEAEKNCYELLKLALKNHYTELQASALNFLALIASQRNQKDLELHYLNQAVSLLRTGELWFLYIQTLINRAFYYWEQNRFTPAELDAEYGLSLAKTRKIPLLTAWSQLLLGRILRDRPRPDLIQAEEYLARAHQGIWKIKNQPLYWELEFDRGLLAKKKGEWEKARGFFKSAEAMLGELLLKVPDFVKQSYLRNRKMEKIKAELELVSPPLKKGD